MLEFRFKNKQWVVFGPPEELKLGLVEVRRTNGIVKTETVIKLSAVFDTPDGLRQYGFVRELPRGVRSGARPRYNFPVTVRKVGE